MSNEQPNFLREVAGYWLRHKDREPRLASLVFVTPNKRSAMFLKKYVREGIRGVALMPRFMTMRTFLGLHAPLPEAPERELLFILYQAYIDAMHSHGRTEGVREFDSFIFWGDIILSDFDEIDRSMANAADLFRNLKNIKEIQADYLDEGQKEVVRRIWGESRLTSDLDRFWLHLDDSESSLGSKFLYLWEILGDVYRNYQEALTKRGYASVGKVYRSAVEHFRNLEAFDISGDTHYVFVGFNDLSTSESLIFERLKELKAASFFWDTVVLTLDCEHGGSSRAMQRLARLSRHFPMPDDFELLMPACTPAVTVTAVPSSIAQTKLLGNKLQEWLDDDSLDGSDGINTAVVLPDPTLLVPALFSVPEGIEKINISLGLPYRSTTFASLLHSVISMQLRARTIHGAVHYFYQDVMAVLTHPHVRMIAAESAATLSKMISEEKLFNIPARKICEELPDFSALFTPVRELGSVRDVATYLTGLFDWLGEALNSLREDGPEMFEIKALSYFRQEVLILSDIIERYGVSMSDSTFLQLFERIFNARGLSVNGAPLQGVQMLGVLETRALDFDNVAILSMNERIFPRRQYTRTMIPNAVRSGFGLPDFENLEWTYAYSFFRLIARAKKVDIYFDTRSEGLAGGEMSRYISQMRFLMPGINVRMRAASLGAEPSSKTEISVSKTDAVMAHIDKFRAGGPLRLSASALKTFKSCPLQFYLAYVRGMRGSDELVDYMTASDYGTIVHKVIQELYEPYRDSPITSTIIRGILGSDIIERTTREEIVRQNFPEYAGKDAFMLPAEAEIGYEVISAIARSDMEAELRAYGTVPFRYKQSEDKYDISWEIEPGLAIRFYMSVDRVDILQGGKLRFIDFKTGKEETRGSVEDMFRPDRIESNGMFQLLTYCEAYRGGVDDKAEIIPMLHPMRELSQNADLVPLKVNGRDVESFRDVSDVFLPELKKLIGRIFDKNEAFTQCEDSRNCRFCPFLALCGRIVPDF